MVYMYIIYLYLLYIFLLLMVYMYIISSLFFGFIVTNNHIIVQNFIEQFVYFESNIVPFGPTVDVGINFVFLTWCIFWFDAFGSTRSEEVIIINGLFKLVFFLLLFASECDFERKKCLPPPAPLFFSNLCRAKLISLELEQWQTQEHHQYEWWNYLKVCDKSALCYQKLSKPMITLYCAGLWCTYNLKDHRLGTWNQKNRLL